MTEKSSEKAGDISITAATADICKQGSNNFIVKSKAGPWKLDNSSYNLSISWYHNNDIKLNMIENSTFMQYEVKHTDKEIQKLTRDVGLLLTAEQFYSILVLGMEVNQVNLEIAKDNTDIIKLTMIITYSIGEQKIKKSFELQLKKLDIPDIVRMDLMSKNLEVKMGDIKEMFSNFEKLIDSKLSKSDKDKKEILEEIAIVKIRVDDQIRDIKAEMMQMAKTINMPIISSGCSTKVEELEKRLEALEKRKSNQSESDKKFMELENKINLKPNSSESLLHCPFGHSTPFYGLYKYHSFCQLVLSYNTPGSNKGYNSAVCEFEETKMYYKYKLLILQKPAHIQIDFDWKNKKLVFKIDDSGGLTYNLPVNTTIGTIAFEKTNESNYVICVRKL